MKKREPLDLDTKKLKNPGDIQPGQVLNPGGRPKGILNKVAKSGQEVKTTVLQRFVRSSAPSLLYAMFGGRTPERFLPNAILDKLKANIPLEDSEDALVKSMNLKNFKWAVEMIAKLVPKQMGSTGLDDEEGTMAGRMRRATVETKSAKVIDMVKKREEKGLYESESE